MKNKIKAFIIISILIIVGTRFYKQKIFSSNNIPEKTIDFDKLQGQIAIDHQKFLDSIKLDYHWLSDSIENDNYKILKIKGSDIEKIDLKYFNKPDTIVTIISSNYSEYNSPEKYEEFTDSYYKINAKGTIIDSLKLMGKDMGDNYFRYIINDNSFYTWIIDGDKTKHLCKRINEDFAMTKEQANEKFRLLYKEASLATMHTVTISNKNSPAYPSEYIPIFFIEKKWVMLFGSDLSIRLNDKYPKTGLNSLNELTNLVENEKSVWANVNKHISLDYFHKTGYQEEYRSNPLAPITLYKPPKWEGEAYLHINLKNKTIPFIIRQDKIIDKDSENYGPISFKYYAHKSLNFGIIKFSRSMYIIKSLK